MTLNEYISKINNAYKSGEATEYSYRTALENYLETISADSGLIVRQEPKHLMECGAPDFVVKNSGGAPVFYIETKPVGDPDLDGRKRTGNKEQFDRYKGALRLVVFTDYLDFHFYEGVQWLQNIRLGEVQGDDIAALPENEERFRSLIASWGGAKPQPIKSAAKLAEIMAGKARLLRHATEKAMSHADDSDEPIVQLPQLFNSFKSWLLQNLTTKLFADIYAQTIVYGLFAACLNKPAHTVFTRQNAASLIPKSNPFLRELFHKVAFDLDERVEWIVDDLAAAFAATEIEKVMGDYGKNSWKNDPMAHFYEDFLAEYDPKLRKDFGVWYTPQPVVSFIVRSVDAILRRDFGFPDGLADSGRAAPKGGKGKPAHRVQILDPAAGTGTFLAKAILQIHDTVARKNAGLWQQYVETDLKPRLNGFELMMAPYTIAHIKLDTTLRDTGYTPVGDRRLNLFLTNALEEPSQKQRTLFNAITVEADEADRVKRDKPVMVLIGNPPYNSKSKNKGEWISDLVKVYKTGLNEKKSNLDDDYIKFIRLGENYVTENKQGIVAYITNNGFLYGVTYRLMRLHLLQNFDAIYLVNLHGSEKFKETADGSDENIFGIKLGVAITILVKTGHKKKGSGNLAKVYYADLRGKKNYKFNILEDSSVISFPFKELDVWPPYYFFVPKDRKMFEEYEEKGFKITSLFPKYVSGIQTKRDGMVVQFTEKDCESVVKDLRTLSEAEISAKYKLKPDGSDWKIEWAKGDALSDVSITPYLYRPFDVRFVPFTGKTKGIMGRPRTDMMQYLLDGTNVSLITTRQISTGEFSHIFASNFISDLNSISLQTKEQSYVFPLYKYNDKVSENGVVLKNVKEPNFNDKIFGRICEGLGREPQPEEVFGYIYAVLHSPRYRERYAELLKIDFPRVPYPTDNALFGKLAKYGEKLLNLHLMRGANKWECKAGFPEGGSNVVEMAEYREGKVKINASQFFAPVSEEEWNFHIGGYQPAQKWLKDRRGHTLSYKDCIHYERMIHALSSTIGIMREIDDLQFPM